MIELPTLEAARDGAPTRPLRIVHLSAAGNAGGAGRAAYRLHQGLLRIGHQSSMLVGHPEGLDDGVSVLEDRVAAASRRGDSWLTRAQRRVGAPLDQLFGLGDWSWPESWRLDELNEFQQADILHLHNLHGGYFNLRALTELSRTKTVVWTLHDMWALTGHCAYSHGCERWRTGCHACPLLQGQGRDLVEPAPTLVDRTRAVWAMKRDVYAASALHIVAPSVWLTDLAQASILGGARSIDTIPYGIDLDLFRPGDRLQARRDLGIPGDATAIFFSADRLQHPRKGGALLAEALRRLADLGPVWLITAGTGQSVSEVSPKVRVRPLGYQVDEAQQQRALAAADLCVSPTLADNLPLTLLEALASGTPTVAFDVGGVGEIIDHRQTGYLARPRDVSDLANGLRYFLTNPAAREHAARQSRVVAERRYGLEDAARRYAALYARAMRG